MKVPRRGKRDPRAGSKFPPSVEISFFVIMGQVASLDNQEQVKGKDSLNVWGSVEEFPLQCEEAWEASKSLVLPDEYRGVTNVVICGMGGSLLGGRVVAGWGAEKLKVPVVLWCDYGVPGCVNEKTLLIACSYSGNTEETLSAVAAGGKREAKIVVLCNGGKIFEIAKAKGWPVYIFGPKYNPSHQPRMAFGYSTIGLLRILTSLGLFEFGDRQMQVVLRHLTSLVAGWGREVVTTTNAAKQIACLLEKRVGIVVSANHLVGGALAMRNMIHENAKQLAFNFELPELNHHLLEGMTYPTDLGAHAAVVFLDSWLYSEKVRERLNLSAEVVKKVNIPCMIYGVEGGSRAEQVFEILQLSVCVSFYMAMVNGVDPGPIPWVEWFKEKLGPR